MNERVFSVVYPRSWSVQVLRRIRQVRAVTVRTCSLQCVVPTVVFLSIRRRSQRVSLRQTKCGENPGGERPVFRFKLNTDRGSRSVSQSTFSPTVDNSKQRPTRPLVLSQSRSAGTYTQAETPSLVLCIQWCSPSEGEPLHAKASLIDLVPVGREKQRSGQKPEGASKRRKDISVKPGSLARVGTWNKSRGRKKAWKCP